mgnify:CR=1 FL=1
MSIVELIIVVALSTEVFTVVFINGFLREAGFSKVLLAGFMVAIIIALLAGMGFLVGLEINKLLENFTDIISTAILLVIGLKILLKSMKSKFQEMTWELTEFKILIGFSLAMGINSFLAGMALARWETPLVALLSLFFGVYFFVVLTGIITGKINRNFILAVRTSFIGGVVLMAVALFSFFYNPSN